MNFKEQKNVKVMFSSEDFLVLRVDLGPAAHAALMCDKCAIVLKYNNRVPPTEKCSTCKRTVPDKALTMYELSK